MISLSHLHTYQATIASMAAYMPRPNQDWPSDTAPESDLFLTRQLPQRAPSIKLQQSISGDYRGHGVSAFANGNKPMPVPTAPQTHMSNGGPRNMHGTGGPGTFDGPRSPPNTKSRSHLMLELSFAQSLISLQILPTYPASSSRLDNVKLAKLVHSLILPTHQSSRHHANTLQRYGATHGIADGA